MLKAIHIGPMYFQECMKIAGIFLIQLHVVVFDTQEWTIYLVMFLITIFSYIHIPVYLYNYVLWWTLLLPDRNALAATTMLPNACYHSIIYKYFLLRYLTTKTYWVLHVKDTYQHFQTYRIQI